MKTWKATQSFTMTSLVNHTLPERYYQDIQEIKKDDLIYEYENVDKYVINRYTIFGPIDDSWKRYCELIDEIPEETSGEPKAQIADNLNSTSGNFVLSANQGRVLSESISTQGQNLTQALETQGQTLTQAIETQNQELSQAILAQEQTLFAAIADATVPVVIELAVNKWSNNSCVVDCTVENPALVELDLPVPTTPSNLEEWINTEGLIIKAVTNSSVTIYAKSTPTKAITVALKGVKVS